MKIVRCRLAGRRRLGYPAPVAATGIANVTSTVRRQPLSLQARLLLAALVVLLFFVLLTGLALDRAYRQSAETAMRERLQDRLYAILAVLDVDARGRPHFDRELPDPRLQQPASGFYVHIEDARGRILLRSPSVLGIALPPADPLPTGERHFDRIDIEGRPHQQLHYALDWETEAGRRVPLQVRLLLDRQPLTEQIGAFRRTLWQWLGGAALLLLLSLVLVLRWSLRPLRRVATALARMERGEQADLGGPYPRELQQLTERLDDLLAHNRRQLQRYRDALGNLAHSLKTPLAILANAIERPADTDIDAARGAVQRIREIIDHQLQRAVAAGPIDQPPVALRPQLERLLQTLRRVHDDRPTRVDLAIPDDLKLRMDTGDLLEVFGNLLDNAFKWTRSRIRISGERRGRRIEIHIEDDGPGIPDEHKDAVRRRGQRADEQVEGHGIGLSMVQEILLLYGGELRIDDSALGGARMTVVLPA